MLHNEALCNKLISSIVIYNTSTREVINYRNTSFLQITSKRTSGSADIPISWTTFAKAGIDLIDTDPSFVIGFQIVVAKHYQRCRYQWSPW